MTIRVGHGSGNQRAEIQLGRIWPVWVSSQQTGSRCQGLRCHAGCCRCHTTGSFCQTVNQTQQRLSWWEAWIDAPFQIKEFQLAGLPRAALYYFLACCDSSTFWFASRFVFFPGSSAQWWEYDAPTTIKSSLSFSLYDNLLFDRNCYVAKQLCDWF